jgi:ribosomal protein L10
MDRAQKQESIETLKGVFAGAGAVVVTHYMGLTVAEMTDLRGRLRKEGARAEGGEEHPGQKALDGSIGEKGDALFKGPVAIAFGRTRFPPPRSSPSTPRKTRSSPWSAASWVNGSGQGLR